MVAYNMLLSVLPLALLALFVGGQILRSPDFERSVLGDLQRILAGGPGKLPFGFANVRGLVFGVSLGLGLGVLWAILCLIYWRVPNEPVPWRAIWPGAAAATVAMAAIDYAFPFYLGHVNTI